MAESAMTPPSPRQDAHQEYQNKALKVVNSACLKQVGMDGKYKGTVACSTDWLVDSIIAALRDERKRALEEAAKVAEQFEIQDEVSSRIRRLIGGRGDA